MAGDKIEASFEINADADKLLEQITEKYDLPDKSMKAYEIDSSMRNELLDLYKILSPFEEVPLSLIHI